MLNLISIIVIGFFLGMRHATDPDHVIAVSTIVSQQRSAWRAAMIGVYWGLGHTLTILLVGCAIILFNVVIPTRFGLAMEFSVSVMLILLGVCNLAAFMGSVRATVADTHLHARAESVHTHSHVPHWPLSVDERRHFPEVARANRFYTGMLRPLVIGIVHGLAGSAAVALLILSSIRNSTWAMAYLLVFGIGTITGMMLITFGLASAISVVGSRFPFLGHRMSTVSGVISLAFGLFLVYQVCLVQQLFGSSPHWTPR